MKNWRYIIIHHSATEDGQFLNDFAAIKRYHTAYRYNSRIITKEKAEQLMAEHKFVIKPCKDIGYHVVIEYDKNVLVEKQGRDLDTQGAHTTGLNGKAIGVCLVGDFDKKEPADEQYDLLVKAVLRLMKLCNIPLKNIRPHSYFASWKSCPGHKFNWTRFIIKITEVLKNGIEDGTTVSQPKLGQGNGQPNN